MDGLLIFLLIVSLKKNHEIQSIWQLYLQDYYLKNLNGIK